MPSKRRNRSGRKFYAPQRGRKWPLIETGPSPYLREGIGQQGGCPLLKKECRGGRDDRIEPEFFSRGSEPRRGSIRHERFLTFNGKKKADDHGEGELYLDVEGEAHPNVFFKGKERGWDNIFSREGKKEVISERDESAAHCQRGFTPSGRGV